MEPTAAASYPLSFDVDEPTEPRNRLTVAFRIIVIIPIAIVAGSVGGSTFGWSSENADTATSAGGGLLFFGPLLMILFRQKYPRWWFDWNGALLRFMNRVVGYLLMLRDEYPATDDDQAYRLELAYPDVPNDLNRWLPLVKWFLAIPHYIVLVFLDLALFFTLIVQWFAILFTGRHVSSIFDFTVGLMRWHNRVIAYAFILTTDRYPPFSFSR